MNVDEIKIALIRYRMNKFQLTVPGIDPFDVDNSMISEFTIDKDYDNSFFPLFMVEVSVPGYVYRAMKKNNYDIKAHVDLQFAKFSEVEPNTKSMSFTSYINRQFYVFFEDTTPDILEDELMRLEKDSGTYNKGYMYGDMATIKLLLYREDYLFKSKKVLNAILSNPTLPDALTYVLNNAGLSGVLISPPNSYRSYKEFIITPVTAMHQLERICNEYALHSNGTMIFFDFQCLYILNKSPKTKAFLPNEIMVTYLASLMQSGPDTVQGKGCFTKPNEYYFANIIPEAINITSESGFNEQVYGNNIMLIDSSTGSVKEISSGADDNKAAKSIGTSRTMMMNVGADSTGSIKSSLLESNKVANLGFSFADLNMFAPNKEYILTLEDTKLKKFNGKYRISRMTCIFEKEGDFWDPHITAKFKG